MTVSVTAAYTITNSAGGGGGGGGSVPSGTGFTHVTGGSQDGTAKVVDLSSGDATGTLAAARMPALTGDITTSAGAVATSLTAGSVTEAKLGLTDLTTANASTSAHGFLPKLPNDRAMILMPDGTWSAQPYPYRKLAAIFDDFIGGATLAAFVTASAGTGAGVNFAATEANSFGIISLATGTQTTGRTQLGLASSGTPSSIVLGLGVTTFTTRARVPVLSNGTDTFTVRLGFGAAVGGGDPTNGIFFRYTDSVNAGKWQAVCRSGGSETASDTGITADTAMHRFEFIVNAGGTSVDFYVDGSKVVTVTSANVPTGTAHATAVQVMNSKSAGTTSVNLDLDWVGVFADLTTER